MASEKKNYLSEEMLKYLDEYALSVGASESTKKEYVYRLNGITRWLCKDFLAITREDAEHYFQYLQNAYLCHYVSKNTIYSRYSLYNNLAVYIHKNQPDLGFGNPFKDIVIDTPNNKVVAPHRIPASNEIDMILSHTSSEMYYLIFALALRVGLSLTEVLGLKLDNIVESNGRIFILIPARKLTPERLVGLPEDIAGILQNYMQGLTYVDSDGHLFYNKYGNPVSRKNICKKLDSIMQKCNLEKGYTMRDFRSRAILDMITASEAKEADVNTVGDYVGIRDRRLRAYMGSSHIIANIPSDLVNISVKPYGNEQTIVQEEVSNE